MLSSAMCSGMCLKSGILSFLALWFAGSGFDIWWKQRDQNIQKLGYLDPGYFAITNTGDQVINIEEDCKDWCWRYRYEGPNGRCDKWSDAFRNAFGFRWPKVLKSDGPGKKYLKRVVHIVTFPPKFILRLFLLLSRGIALIPLSVWMRFGNDPNEIESSEISARKATVLGTGYGAAGLMTLCSGWYVYKWISSWFKPKASTPRAKLGVVTEKWQTASTTGKAGMAAGGLAATCGLAYGGHKLAKKCYDKIPESVRSLPGKLKFCKGKSGKTDSCTPGSKTDGISTRAVTDSSIDDKIPWVKYSIIAVCALVVLAALFYFLSSGKTEKDAEGDIEEGRERAESGC